MEAPSLGELVEITPRVVKEWYGESDRAAAVLGAAFLDDQLALLLRATIRGGSSTESRLLERDRPLSSFSARIETAYGFGLISKQARDDLHLIRKIRNRFAHRVTDFDFESAGLKDRVRSLEIPAIVETELAESSPISDELRGQFVDALRGLSLVLTMRVVDAEEASPPTRFADAWNEVRKRAGRGPAGSDK